ncbi:hypothetical protein FOZ61_004417 [Perkinsus olseni]|uniref:Uncharacterized protein n=1 Tax=Perkinsus olseni TaxID=32597 RepID=A0A7J6LZ81_PEROL|nr:hypothetical protein FOZ61_004417 [Perkinsus olseni]KAF4664544.1 hypothetical protein FOL46_004168 [Perkinsus olseni]
MPSAPSSTLTTTADCDFLDAARRGDFVACKAIRDNDESVDINTVSPDTGMSAAHYCVIDGGDRDVMEWLHKEGIDWHVRDLDNRTPLQCAIQRSAQSAVDFFVSKVFDPVESIFFVHFDELPSDDTLINIINDPSINERQLTHMFPQFNGMQLCHLLAESSRRAALHALGSRLKTPLSSLLDCDGNGCLHYASANALIRLQRKMMPEENDEEDDEDEEEMKVYVPSPEALHEVLTTMQDLVRVHGVDVNQTNDSGDTASHLVAGVAPTGEIALAFLQCLHQLGADMRVRNCDSQCVGMILAEMHGNGPWIDWIVTEAGCDATAVSSEGLTIYQYADEHDEEWDSSSSSSSSTDEYDVVSPCLMGGLDAIQEEDEEDEDDDDEIQEAD